MPTFRFIGDEPRIFGDFSLEARPGDVADFDENPDGHFWEAADDAAAVSAAMPPDDTSDAAPADESPADAEDAAPDDAAPTADEGVTDASAQ